MKALYLRTVGSATGGVKVRWPETWDELIRASTQVLGEPARCVFDGEGFRVGELALIMVGSLVYISLSNEWLPPPSAPSIPDLNEQQPTYTDAHADTGIAERLIEDVMAEAERLERQGRFAEAAEAFAQAMLAQKDLVDVWKRRLPAAAAEAVIVSVDGFPVGDGANGDAALSIEITSAVGAVLRSDVLTRHNITVGQQTCGLTALAHARTGYEDGQTGSDVGGGKIGSTIGPWGSISNVGRDGGLAAPARPSEAISTNMPPGSAPLAEVRSATQQFSSLLNTKGEGEDEVGGIAPGTVVNGSADSITLWDPISNVGQDDASAASTSPPAATASSSGVAREAAAPVLAPRRDCLLKLVKRPSLQRLRTDSPWQPAIGGKGKLYYFRADTGETSTHKPEQLSLAEEELRVRAVAELAAEELMTRAVPAAVKRCAEMVIRAARPQLGLARREFRGASRWSFDGQGILVPRLLRQPSSVV